MQVWLRVLKSEFSPRKVLFILLFVISILLLANLTGIFISHFFGHDSIYGLIDLFDFDRETNIPTLFSSLQLLLASGLLLLSGLRRDLRPSNTASWFVLTAIFLFLAVDEFAQIHERLTLPLRRIWNLTGIFYYAWVIPYSALGIAMLLMFSRFLRALPRRLMWRILASAVIYLSGAIVLEMAGGMHAAKFGVEDFTYAIIYTVEELLEMIGIAHFIFALLDNMWAENGNIRTRD